ncbi:MAG: CHRD domain-containing protein [Candidatus Nitrosopolaris sp.]|jgi:hypothetical protein
MPAAIDPVIKKQVVKQWLLGDSRDRIAADNGIGAGTVSNIIDDFKKGVQDSDFSSVRELAIHCKKEGVDLRDLAPALRIKNHYNRLTQLGTNVSEEQVEAYIVNLASSPDPAKLIEAAAQISESDVPLEKLEEHVKALKAEKETLQREIDEGRTILDGVDVDVENRRKLVEEYAQKKAGMRRYGIGPEDPKRFSNVLQVLQRSNYDCAKILGAFADVEDVRKLRSEVEPSDIRGNLTGKQIMPHVSMNVSSIPELTNLFTSGNAYGNVHTQQHQNGKIRGQIGPSSNTTAAAPSTSNMTLTPPSNTTALIHLLT